MSDVIAFILGLAVVLGIVAVVGHGIWTGIAALMSGGATKPGGSAGLLNCPRCGARLQSGLCTLCQWPGPLPHNDRTLRSLQTLRWQLDQWLRLKVINADAHRRLLEALEAERVHELPPIPLAEVVTDGVGQACGLTSDEPTTAPMATPVGESSGHRPDLPIATPVRSPEERVRQYAVSRAEAIATADATGDSGATPTPLAEPRARLANLLSAFMEEKNIRWGELVGGLLIVCCSIALVISFWAQIAERPFLKFFLFNGVTAGLFGLGLYSAHRWKLRTTSQAVLTISILLVPLNFLAIAAFSQDNPANLAWTIAGEIVSLALFAAFCYFGGREVTPRTPWLLVVGVIVPSAVQLVIRRWVNPNAPLSLLYELGAAPLVVYAAVNCWGLWRQRDIGNDHGEAALTPAPGAPGEREWAGTHESLRLLGATTFAALLPLGLLLFKTGRAEAAVHQLAVLISGASVPALAVGLFYWRRLTAREFAGLRTAVLSVAVAGVAALAAGVALAWPTPLAMVPAALIAAAILVAIAVTFRMPEAHLPAVACATLTYVTLWQIAAGRIGWQEQDARQALGALVSGASGQALVGLSVLLFAAAGIARLLRRAADGLWLAIGAAAVATASIGLVCWFGFAVPGDPLKVTWILAFYAVGCCVAGSVAALPSPRLPARRERGRTTALWIGAALSLAASVQGVVFLATTRWPLAMPWATALAVDASLLVIAALICRAATVRERVTAVSLPDGRGSELAMARQVFSQAALAASAGLLALTFAGSIGGFEAASPTPLSIHWFWLAAVWLLLAWEWPPLVVLSQLALVVGVWLRLAEHGTLTGLIGLAHLNAIVAAGTALSCVAIRAATTGRQSKLLTAMRQLLLSELVLAAMFNAIVLAPAWTQLVGNATATQTFRDAADGWGWAAALLTVAASWSARDLLDIGPLVGSEPARSDAIRNGPIWLLVSFALATLIAWTACRWDTGDWLGYRVLLVCHVAAAWVIAGVGAWREPAFVRRGPIANIGLIAMAFVVGLALRALDSPVGAPWWTIAALASQALLAVWLGWWSLRGGLLYIAAVLINVTTTIWWDHAVRPIGGGRLAEWIEINVVALALPVVVWLLLEVRRFAPHCAMLATERDPELLQEQTERTETKKNTSVSSVTSCSNPNRLRPEQSVPPVHRVATRLSLTALAVVVGGRLALTAVPISPLPPVAWPEWLALLAAGIAAIACLWDGESPGAKAVAALYAYGLFIAGVWLDYLHLEPKWLWWSGDIVLAAYALATSCLWWRQAGLRAIADRLRIPRGDDSPQAALQWLVPLNCTLVVLVVILSYSFVLTFDDRAWRLLAAKAVLFQMATVGLLAEGQRRWRLQYFALVLGALGAVAIGWAALDPKFTSGLLLNRTVVVAAALAITAIVYGLGLGRLLKPENDWLRAAVQLTPVLVAADAIAILFTLGFEGLEVVNTGHVAMAPAAMITVVVVLIGLCVACLAAAVLPGRDPLALSDRGRSAYVYAAEALLALLFVHIRLTKPEWFHGFFAQYWPLIVQGIAFVGVGVGEWFRRRRWVVVGEPLATTGAFLPLLPVIGFWVLPTRVDYSLLLLAVGALYGAMSVARRSFGFGLLALAAANGSLWYFLHQQQGFGFLDHPQLWLIPPSLCVLAASHLNRRQLTAAQMTAIRYAASIVLYVSSTADIFVQGVAHAPWLPIVLGGLSLVGVFAGILLRVRAFLILGCSFLVVSLLTIIWYAAVDLQQTWLWSATGIATGVLILIVFAVFEKQRQAVLNVLEKMKTWQP